MATPNEQHGARARAHVVGSGHMNGREPLVEARAAAEAADDPRTDSPTSGGVPPADGPELHRAPARAPHADNTDRRG